jgi:ribosome maturation factor RimP
LASCSEEEKVRELIGKVVEVHTADMMYTGRLVEVNEEEVYLESESGWVVVPLGTVAIIKAKEGG